MPDFYSGQISDIEELMRHVGIGDTKVDAIPENSVERYQGEIDDIINTTLRPHIEVPLRKVTRNGNTDFPAEIKFIARRLVAAEVILNEMTEVDSNSSRSAEDMKRKAMRSLYQYVNGPLVGSHIMDGQEPRARNQYARPTTPPREPEPPEAFASP